MVGNNTLLLTTPGWLSHPIGCLVNLLVHGYCRLFIFRFIVLWILYRIKRLLGPTKHREMVEHIDIMLARDKDSPEFLGNTSNLKDQSLEMSVASTFQCCTSSWSCYIYDQPHRGPQLLQQGAFDVDVTMQLMLAGILLNAVKQY